MRLPGFEPTRFASLGAITMRLPGFEPGSQAWEARILPLDYNRQTVLLPFNILKALPWRRSASHSFFWGEDFFFSEEKGSLDPAGIEPAASPMPRERSTADLRAPDTIYAKKCLKNSHLSLKTSSSDLRNSVSFPASLRMNLNASAFVPFFLFQRAAILT
jgi:hypothetical protein